ncbi:MAG: hypothetical protein AAF587_02790 [Bacteroidota bacterium]
MKKTFEIVVLLSLLIGISLIACQKTDPIGTSVSMRKMAVQQGPSLNIGVAPILAESVTSQVPNEWTSEIIRVVNGQVLPCQCDSNDFKIDQIFLKTNEASDDHSFLFQNGQNTNVIHTFSGNDFIGIDMTYQGNYVRMSDIPVFGQGAENAYRYQDKVGVRVFYNQATGSQSAAYSFPIGSSEDDPTVSTTGLWMRIVLDFN